VISRATERRFVCTLPATSCCTQLSVEPQCCAACVPTPPTSLTTARQLLQAPVSTVTTDRIITAAGKCSALARSVERWTFCQYCYGLNLTQRHAAFKVRGDTGPASYVILSLWLAHAARCLVSATQVRKTTSAQLQPRIAIVADWQAQ